MNVREKLQRYAERRKETDGESFMYEEQWAEELHKFVLSELNSRVTPDADFEEVTNTGLGSYPEDLDFLEPDDEKLDALWARWKIEEES